MQKKQDNIGLIWFRNDLRVQDNYTLNQAISNHKHLIACYCFDPKQYSISKFGFKKTERYRAQFLIETINQLKTNLKQLNIELFITIDTPENAIKNLVDIFSISSIYLQKEWTHEEVQTLARTKSSLPNTIIFHEYYDQFLFHPDDIQMSFDEIPEVFTRFRKNVELNSTVRPVTINSPSEQISEITNDTYVPTLQELGFEVFGKHPNSAFPFEGGETNAIQRLDDYFFKSKKIASYKKTRNGLVGVDFSSKFSPWLANGSISARTIYWQIKTFEDKHIKNESTYWLIFELIWRDYFKYIALKHQNDIFKLGGILHKDYDWYQNENQIKKWINGTTPSHFVNANMIELAKTGWMSNRGRQNVASYFAKDMHLDWRIGAAYFESMLIDYDVHSNYGNWMYVAGVGNDPRDRKFNVKLQAERYDANGRFQNLWLQNTLF
ncbi:DASH family cryptochrome [Psychroserpens algicola]|uniref:Cryptochrome DASH n=1 Tax=Psychroserpens algicola TaxID=1719034 RepID=A0ABT0HE04_9FLAO|nr:DASH family cryptochrome [Psychroserpens algicola]